MVAALLVAVPELTHAQSSDSVGHVAQLTPRALAELLADASRRNLLPPDLVAYRAGVETEISVLMRREEGTEAVVAVEQVASTLRWTRSGYFDQHVVGYRAQQSAATFSMLSIFQTGWVTPALYGNRLRVRTSTPRAPGRPSVRAAGNRNDGADTLPAVHPLAADRDAYYTFSGGDTAVTIRAGDRVIPIAQVRVTPKRDVVGPVVVFEGDLALDASRGTLVRMRGTFLRVGGPKRALGGALGDAVAFVEYENGERYGTYWLPATQRVELQATIPALGDQRAVIRIVSKFRDMQVNDTVLSAATLAAADSLRATSRRRLTYATNDTIRAFGTWNARLGTLSEGMHADDFLDVAPDRWRPVGPPRFDWTAPRASDVFHFNRVEGAYTGFGAKLSLRDAAPGVIVRVNGGYAWSDQQFRGRASVERRRGGWLLEARGGRSIDNTNDFRVPFDSGNTIGALIGSQDPYDYVDRTSATLAAVKTFGARTALLRVEGGVADDRYRPAVVERGLLGRERFRPNRGVDEGSYVRSSMTFEWHPDVSAEFVKPGVNARLFVERGDGTLDFQRSEVRVVSRQPVGPFTWIARADAGVVTGARIPSQQLFELGEQQNLPGYADKEFAGSRAAVLRSSLLYQGPWFREPIRVGRRFFLPAFAPGASVGIQSGWTEAPNAAARASIDRLAITEPTALALYAPVSRPSDGIRASVTAGLRFFGSGVFVGATRPVDQAAPWKFLVSFGQQW